MPCCPPHLPAFGLVTIGGVPRLPACCPDLAKNAKGTPPCLPTASREQEESFATNNLACDDGRDGAMKYVDRTIDVQVEDLEVMFLDGKLSEANGQLADAVNQNAKLVNRLAEAREQIASLKEEVDKLCAPPPTYGVYLSVNEDGTVNIRSQGRQVKVNLHPSIKAETLKPGQELVLNEGLNVVEAAGYEIQGDVVILKEQLDEERAVVTLLADEEKVGIIADPLRLHRLKIGDHILMDATSGYRR